jgi:hypothetical protein
MSLTSIQKEIQKLEPTEKASLIDLLWESLDEEHTKISRRSGPLNPKIESKRLSEANYLLLMGRLHSRNFVRP